MTTGVQSLRSFVGPTFVPGQATSFVWRMEDCFGNAMSSYYSDGLEQTGMTQVARLEVTCLGGMPGSTANSLIQDGTATFSLNLPAHNIGDQCTATASLQGEAYGNSGHVPAAEVVVRAGWTHLRLCPPGFVLHGHACIRCSPDQYTSEQKPLECLTCPPGASCPGGDQVVSEEGRWVYLGVEDKEFHTVQCSTSRCRANNTCSENCAEPVDQNPMCGRCKPGYSAVMGQCKGVCQVA